MKHFDDDMDELFNKAGRDYPLKTEPKNWDAVRGALHPEEVAPVSQRKNGWRKYLPLLLVLLIPIAVYMFVERKYESSAVATQNGTGTENKNHVSDHNEPLSGNRDISIDKNQIEKESESNTQRNPQSINAISSKSEKTGAGKRESENIAGRKNKNEIVSQGISQSKTKSQSQSNIKSQSQSQSQNEDKSTNANKTQSENRTKIQVDQDKQKFSSQLSNNRTENQKDRTAPNNVIRSLSYWNSFPPPGESSSQEITVNVPVKAQGQAQGTESVPNAKKKKYSNKTGFYYGITAAPDVSMIKGQDIKGAGYSAGIIAGYQFNGHWSVEAGMLWSRKKYFTNGKYFDKEDAQIPSTVDVLWLDGGCNMFEFPLVARYDFSRKKNTFFAAAGLISYMMKKEDYKYGAKAGPAPWYYEGEREYDRSGDHLFANLQLSAGYKFSLSPKMNIRIEPYLKAPLKKIGIGKMPITSAGLSFGITRDFH